jgi:hypothetical protein
MQHVAPSARPSTCEEGGLDCVGATRQPPSRTSSHATLSFLELNTLCADSSTALPITWRVGRQLGHEQIRRVPRLRAHVHYQRTTGEECGLVLIGFEVRKRATPYNPARELGWIPALEAKGLRSQLEDPWVTTGCPGPSDHVHYQRTAGEECGNANWQDKWVGRTGRGKGGRSQAKTGLGHRVSGPGDA